MSAGASLAQVWVYKSGTSGEQWPDEVCLQGAGAAPVGTAAARMVAPGRCAFSAFNRSTRSGQVFIAQSIFYAKPALPRDDFAANLLGI